MRRFTHCITLREPLLCHLNVRRYSACIATAYQAAGPLLLLCDLDSCITHRSRYSASQPLDAHVRIEGQHSPTNFIDYRLHFGLNNNTTTFHHVSQPVTKRAISIAVVAAGSVEPAATKWSIRAETESSKFRRTGICALHKVPRKL